MYIVLSVPTSYYLGQIEFLGILANIFIGMIYMLYGITQMGASTE
jgi:hypothetical protein